MLVLVKLVFVWSESSKLDGCGGVWRRARMGSLLGTFSAAHPVPAIWRAVALLVVTYWAGGQLQQA
mgnify:CR=1 FL=1